MALFSVWARDAAKTEAGTTATQNYTIAHTASQQIRKDATILQAQPHNSRHNNNTTDKTT